MGIDLRQLSAVFVAVVVTVVVTFICCVSRLVFEKEEWGKKRFYSCCVLYFHCSTLFDFVRASMTKGHFMCRCLVTVYFGQLNVFSLQNNHPQTVRSLTLSFKWTPVAGVSMNDPVENCSSFPICWSSISTQWCCSIRVNPTTVDILPILKPIQFRGPSPNGKYGISFIVFPFLFTLKNRDGSNFAGSG